MIAQLAIVPGLVAALSEGQRPIAHLVLVLGLLGVVAAVGLVQLIRRRVRRPDQTHERQRIPEEER
jgi:hypothetical protein